MLRLHHHPTSPYSRKVSVAVHLLDAPVEAVIVDVTRGEHRAPAFTELSPFERMPVLETPDGPVFESTSILEWLDERFGPRLIPAAVAREARHWDRLGDLYLIEAQSVILFRGGTEAAEDAVRTAQTAWGLLDAALADGRAFVTGDAFTLGDLSAAIGTDYLQRMDLRPPDRVAAWCDRCFAIDPMEVERRAALPLMDVFLSRRVPTPG